MLAPFMLPELLLINEADIGGNYHLPERLVITLVVLPVGLHVGQDIAMTLVLKNTADISVCSRAITSGFVGAVAVVGPCAVVSIAVPC